MDTLFITPFNMTQLILNQDQQKAYEDIAGFLADDTETVYVLTGSAGTGKSTLVKKLVEDYDKLISMASLISSNISNYQLRLTATTNKAAENLSEITGEVVITIYSLLSLSVRTDYRTGKTTIKRNTQDILENLVIFIDEASYSDSVLLGYIFNSTKNCKIIFIGDKYQLLAVRAQTAPVFAGNFNSTELTTTVRQSKGNPITELAHKFRDTVKSGDFFSFKPDGQHIQHMDRDSFNAAILKEFCRPDWHFKDSKILVWSNASVTEYNKYVDIHSKGYSDFAKGDYVICNEYFNNGRSSFKTDQTVMVTHVSQETAVHGVVGRWYELDGKVSAFCPLSRADKTKAITRLKRENNIQSLSHIYQRWIDIRSLFACTVYKSQGSTYDRVFIDLNDMKKAPNGDALARALYVAVSRARYQVYLTGDLV